MYYLHSKKLPSILISLFLLNISIAKTTISNEEILFSNPIAKYENNIINQSDFESFLLAIFGYPVNSVINEEELNNYVSAFLRADAMKQYAKKNGLNTDPSFTTELAALEYRIANKIITNNFLSQVTIEDDEIQKMYSDYLNSIDKLEYQIEYVMTKNEKDAFEALNLYKDYDNFQIWAKKIIELNPELYQSGILGNEWVSLSNLNNDLSPIIEELSLNTETLSSPQKLYDSYYIFYIKNKREVTPWPLVDLKDNFIDEIKSKKLETYLNEKFPIPKYELNIEK